MGLITVMCIMPYATLMLLLVAHDRKQKKSTPVPTADLKAKFSIIVPMRNEAKNLLALWDGLNQQNYPIDHFEVIFVNDQSTDDGPIILSALLTKSQLDAQLLHTYGTSFSPKKQALVQGINQSRYPWIITLDADTTMGRDWLNAYNDLIATQSPDFIAGPVALTGGHDLLFDLQDAEFSALQLVTHYTFQNDPVLCNGANLAFKSSVFEALNGYKGNEHIASGDDVFLLRKVALHPTYRAVFMNDDRGLVWTKGAETWRKLWFQRMRWASKTRAIGSWRLSAIAILVLSTNVGVLALFFAALLGLASWTIFMVTVSVKIVVDFLTWRQKQQQRSCLVMVINTTLGALTYPLLTLFLGALSYRGRYTWKDRQF